jgi:formylglycine-generating enzyme required for sulfatase activity
VDRISVCAVTARVLIGLGGTGLLACVGAFGWRWHAITLQREASRSVFEQHRAEAGEMVALAGFAIDKTEVTVAAYRACVAAGRCTRPAPGQHCSFDLAGHDEHPVNCVTQAQAATFCAWAGRRLPTRLEWGLAGCAAGPPKQSPGECVGRHDVFEGYGGRTVLQRPAMGTCPVLTGVTTPEGLFGMGGNVSEWTSSEPDPGRSNRWTYMGPSWIMRLTRPFPLSCYSGMPEAPGYQDSLIGFRCARSADQPIWREVIGAKR